jgi:RecA-family ATPase
MTATALSFTETLCAAYDLEHPHRDHDARVTRADVLEYINAASVDKRHAHPTTVIQWDLIRTFGESEGRRLFLQASRQWDAVPLRARDVVFKWWDDDHEPVAWQDEYLADLIGSWRTERERARHCIDGEREWEALANDFYIKQSDYDAWDAKYGGWIPFSILKHKYGPFKIVPDGCSNVLQFPAQATGDRTAKIAAAQAELDAFKGVVTQKESDAWFTNYHDVATEMQRTDIKIIPNDRAVKQMREQPAPEPIALPVFSAASLEGQPVPPRRWHVRDWIPAETVTLLYGDGGTGKSLIALQLLASTALGRPWLGRLVEKGVCLFVTAEDSRDEVHRRLTDIARENGVPLSALTDLHIVSLAGEDAIMAAPDGRSSILVTTALFTAMEAQFSALRPRFVVLDTLADLFGGNEIDRAQARQFIGLLRGLALRHAATVLLLAHPSVAGMTKGTGSSGSTGWNNSVRSRLYFDRIRADDNSEPDPDARVLRLMKSNYGRVGGEIVLHWRRGVFAPEQVTAGGLMAAHDAQTRTDEAFLKLLMLYEAEGRGAVSPNPGSNYAPKIFADHALAQGFKARALKSAMDRLLAAKRIETIMTGPPSRIRQHLVVSTHNGSVSGWATNAPTNAIPTPSNAPTNALLTAPKTLPPPIPTPCYPNPHTPMSPRAP